MRIKQCYYAEARIGNFTNFLKNNNLNKYSSSKEPAIFFGMYSKIGLNVLKNHKALAVIIWRGTDIISKKKRLESVVEIMKTNKNIKHVAISSYIERDLKKTGISYKFLPITASDLSGFESCPLGNEIYIYAPSTRYNFYGGAYFDKITDKCRFKINVGRSVNCYTKEELHDIYRKSFLGLRLTQHDGIANQVIEMGLMGRKCVHNGNHPNAIPWKNSESILRIIEEESKYIGITRNDIVESVKQYINIKDDWLKAEFWT